jgi:UDP-N-acetylmuramoyl-L-alanyl-D-glutamate--2,6-diaminopimelate ligase
MANKDKLLETIQIIDRTEGDTKPITSLAYHSGRVMPGALFICIRGYETDGHLYLAEAAKNGAVAAVVEYFQSNISIPQYKVEDSRLAMAALADRFYDHPSRKLAVTGVTATNGKTTTTYMINAIFEEHGLNTGLIGTVIIKTGELICPAILTTPESLDLHYYFSKMVKNKISHAVMEVSSSGLELNRIGFVDFNTVVVNNISREHIDLHGSFEAYYKAKSRLAREATENQWAVLNLDCPYTAALKNETKAKTLTYGMKNQDADCLVQNLDLSTGRAEFTVKLDRKISARILNGQPESFVIKLSVLGLHSVYNAMAAILVALIHGIPASTIQKALKKFKGVERRFELIFENDFMVIDDHFANSGNIDVTLETLGMMNYRKLHLVYAIRGSRGVTVNRENAEAIARWAPKLGLGRIIATTSIEHVDKKDLVTEAEIETFQAVMDKAGLKTVILESLAKSIALGLAETGPGDVLLLAGCQGMDYGASVCLKQIHKLKPELPDEIVFAALKNRVAGI